MRKDDRIAPSASDSAEPDAAAPKAKSCAEVMRDYYAYRYELIKEKYENNEYTDK